MMIVGMSNCQRVDMSGLCGIGRETYPYPEAGSIEEAILESLKLNGSMITRDLRKACAWIARELL